MAKDKKKARDATAGRKTADEGKPAARAADAAGGQHHEAKAHGRPTKIDTRLPSTRSELMVLHRDARARRNAAPLDSPAFRAAVMDLERIEVRIAAVDRAQDPPLG